MTLGERVASGELSFRSAESILRNRKRKYKDISKEFLYHVSAIGFSNVDLMNHMWITRQTASKKLRGIGIVETDVLALKGALLCKRIEEGMQPLLAVALYKDSK